MNEFSTTIEYLKTINICIWFATFPQNTATNTKQQEPIIFCTRTIFRYKAREKTRINTVDRLRLDSVHNCIDLLAICLGSNLAYMSHSQSKPVVYGHFIYLSIGTVSVTCITAYVSQWSLWMWQSIALLRTIALLYWPATRSSHYGQCLSGNHAASQETKFAKPCSVKRVR